jgi:outer membrane protein OmpA-like peptidoglycan-associated protein
MTNPSFLTKAELSALGLNKTDSQAFIALRVKHGGIDTPEAIARLKARLSSDGVKKVETLFAAQPPMSTMVPLPAVQLVLRPKPMMISADAFKVTVRFHRLVDSEAFEFEQAFDTNGENQLAFHDASLAHAIHIKVTDKADAVLAERLLTPSGGAKDEPVWTATPPIGPDEELVATRRALGARLDINLRKPAKITPTAKRDSEVFARNGRFLVPGQPGFSFIGYSLSIAAADDVLTSAVKGHLDTNDGATAALLQLDVTDPAFAKLAAMLPLVSAEMDSGGTFRIRQERQTFKTAKGWMWALVGPEVFIGFRPDVPLSEPAPDALIFLPSSAKALPVTGIPHDVTEATILANPDLFADDPGTSCRPFSSPSRILGEKRFRTVVRVTQPQVAKAGQNPITFESQGKRPTDFPRLEVNPANPVDYEGDPARFQAQTVAFGHILEQVIRYRSNGYSLGYVAHSMTLAPREKRRTMKVDFARSNVASRSEFTANEDSVMDTLDALHEYDNAVSGQLGEWSRGSSSSSAVGGALGVGAVIPVAPVVIGGGVSAGSAQSTATQSSRREATTKESQRLMDSIRRYGESLRSLESTVVTESAQSESVTGTSEVVQNINYTRALTIVYYEILRHMRIDTEIGSVTECVFVPMPIKEWSDARISRHRKTLARYARGWLERSVFRYLDDIQTNFEFSEIPAGIQADQPLNQLSGSLTLTMGVNMPVNGTPSPITTTDSETALHQTVTQLETAWDPYAALLPMPVPVLAQQLQSLRTKPAAISKLFNDQIAPAMARAVIEKFTLAGTEVVTPIDFTPQTAYKRGVPMRVDFDVMVSGSLTRNDLRRLVLRASAEHTLPPGSWINLTSASIKYETEHYNSTAVQHGGKRDLLDTTTGLPDTHGAQITFRRNAQDQLNLREELRKGYIGLKKTLEAETFRYHKAVWRSIDPDELYSLLDGYAFDNEDGRSLASVIERRPIGILGNSLIFATRTDWPLDPQFETFEALRANYIAGMVPVDPIRVSLPTSGLYARAHLDECISAEEHNGSFDWVFDNQEPELADFPTGMFDSRRETPTGLTPSAMPETLISLQNAPTMPAATGAGAMLTALGNDAFRDITGLAGTQAAMQAAMTNATSLAASGMSQGAKLAELASDARAAKDVNAFRAAMARSSNEGLISKEDATQALTCFANRKAAGGTQPAPTDLHENVLKSDGEATHSSTDADGTTKTTTKKAAPRKPDPVAAISVAQVSDNQLLFFNYPTGQARPTKAHIDAIEQIAGTVGIAIEDISAVVGHASKAGSDETNLTLGMERAKAIFAHLRGLVVPLGASPAYQPSFDQRVLSSEGEAGSMRARFAAIPGVGDAKGQGEPNDPVEKAVLVTFAKPIPINLRPKVHVIGGVEYTFINNFLYFGNTAICALPGKDITVIDRSSTEVRQENLTKTEIQQGSNNVIITRDSNNTTINFSIFDGSTITNAIEFYVDSLGHLSEPTPTATPAETPRKDWILRFYGPRIEGARSLMTIISDIAQAVPIAGALPGGASGLAKEVIDEATKLKGTPDATTKLQDFIIEKLGLKSFADILTKVQFGSLRFRADISAKDVDGVSSSGEFVAPGVVAGTQNFLPNTPIMEATHYVMSEEKKLSDWNKTMTMTEFNYFVNGTSIATNTASGFAQALGDAIPTIVSDLVPEFAKIGLSTVVLTALDTTASVLKSFNSQTAVRFKALPGDAGLNPSNAKAIPTALEVQLFVMSRGQISYVADKG